MLVFFFNDTATTEIYTLSLHDALPIFDGPVTTRMHAAQAAGCGPIVTMIKNEDRKSTRLNSSHLVISYAVFCLKKKKMSYFDSRYDLLMSYLLSIHVILMLLYRLVRFC